MRGSKDQRRHQQEFWRDKAIIERVNINRWIKSLDQTTSFNHNCNSFMRRQHVGFLTLNKTSMLFNFAFSSLHVLSDYCKKHILHNHKKRIN